MAKRRRSAQDEAPASEPEPVVEVTREWNAGESSSDSSNALELDDGAMDEFVELASAGSGEDSASDSEHRARASAASSAVASASAHPVVIKNVTFPAGAITASLSALPAGGELFLTALRQRTRPGSRSAYDFGHPVDVALSHQQINVLQQRFTSARKLAAEESSDSEEDTMHSRNTLGKIPLEWYDDYDHMGYDLDGKAIAKPADGQASMDAIDRYIERTDNPDYWRQIYDQLKQQNSVLTPKEMEMIRRLQKGKLGDMDFDPYEDWLAFFDFKDGDYPLVNLPEPKSRFLPSKWEAKKVAKIVRAIRQGRIRPKVVSEPPLTDLWEQDDLAARRNHIPAPKPRPPTTAESYNPPDEYLFDEKEMKKWSKLDPEKRRQQAVPRKYDALRKVPAYEHTLQDRFDRCLDLFMASRQQVMRTPALADPSSILPQLPKPQDLRPFPSKLALVYSGHTGKVRCIDVSPSGQWLVSGSNDGTLRLWEVDTGRMLRKWDFAGETVQTVKWCPLATRTLFAAALGSRVLFINPGLGASADISATDETCFDSLHSALVEDEGAAVSGEAKMRTVWRGGSRSEHRQGIRVVVTLPFAVRALAWHARGDYLATVLSETSRQAVAIHQFTRKRSQVPFGKKASDVQRVAFHPTEPFFFVATRRRVHVYDLAKQMRVKSLMPGFAWISTLAVHPSGNHVLVGSYDSKVAWFDLDYGAKPFRVLRFHRFAVRALAFHTRYPLFATCSDDGTVQVLHGRVFNDYNQDALIVPLKILRGHRITDEIGVIDCVFHPKQPWIFSAAADANIHLYT